MQAAHCFVWDGIRRLATGHNITRQQTMGLLHTPIQQACHMMKWKFDKAVFENNAVVDNGKAFDHAFSYVILFYEWHLDGPRVFLPDF